MTFVTGVHVYVTIQPSASSYASSSFDTIMGRYVTRNSHCKTRHLSLFTIHAWRSVCESLIDVLSLSHIWTCVFINSCSNLQVCRSSTQFHQHLANCIYRYLNILYTTISTLFTQICIKHWFNTMKFGSYRLYSGKLLSLSLLFAGSVSVAGQWGTTARVFPRLSVTLAPSPPCYVTVRLDVFR